LEFAAVSGGTHNSAYIGSQLAWTGREIFKVLNNFSFVVIAVVIVGLASVSNI
jgi:hypothetical protein